METIMTFLYETHCHTKEVSACAHVYAQDLMRAYHQQGYRGVIITDHFFNGNCGIPPHLDWPERVHAFCEGYNQGKSYADLHEDFDVFFGFEYGYHGTEFLILGLDESWLLKNPTLLSWPIRDFFNAVHEDGGFIIHAHPFRQRPYIKEIRLFTDLIDAVEGFNQGNDLPEYNDAAMVYATQHGLPITRGSDAHWLEDIKMEGLRFDHEIKDLSSLIEAIKLRLYVS